MNWTKKYKKAVTFSYDDGVEQDLRLLEILNKYNLKATFNLNTGLNSGSYTWNYKELEVRRLDLENHINDYDGHEVAVHTLTHPDLCKLEKELVSKEVLSDKENLEKIFGTKVCGMAYPFGTYSDEVVEFLKNNDLKYARTVEASHNFKVQNDLLRFKPTCHHDDSMLFDLAESFLKSESKEVQIFYIWGHAYEFEGNHNWDRFEDFCKLISGRDDIFYGTNREVLLEM